MSFNFSCQGSFSSDSPSGPNGTYKPTDITLQDLLAFQKLDFVVTAAIETQTTESIRDLLAPTIKVDLSAVNGVAKDFTLDEYFTLTKEMAKKDTHYHQMLGGGYYERVSDTEAMSKRQVMMTFLVHKGDDHAEVDYTVTTTGEREYFYTKINGEWKWAGNKVIPRIFGENYEKLPFGFPGERQHWHKQAKDALNGMRA